MQKFDQADPKSIENFAKKLEGSTLFNAISRHGFGFPNTVNDKNKGNFGLILEKYYFGLKNNNEARPDFPEARVELKATPIRQTRKGEFSAKERLVLGNIDYSTISNETFEFSKFFHKAELLLLVFYIYRTDKKFFEYIISLASLWSIPKEDLEIITQDWLKVVEMVKKGEAHKITSGATMYLEACRGGGKNTSLFMQASGIPAKKRRFALKPAYMTSVYSTLASAGGAQFKSITETGTGKRATPDEVVIERFSSFYGLHASDIAKQLGVKFNIKDKGRFAALSNAILGAKRKQSILEFEKSNTLMRTVRATRSGALAESVSFPAFKFSELIEEKWEPADEEEEKLSGYKDILQSRVFFVVYRCDDAECLDPVLEVVKFWTMPEEDLEGPVRRMWEETVEAIKRSDPKSLPGISHENGVAHVRPHGRRGVDVDTLPDGSVLTKQCFWLNSQYIAEQLSLIKTPRRPL